MLLSSNQKKKKEKECKLPFSGALVFFQSVGTFSMTQLPPGLWASGQAY